MESVLQELMHSDCQGVGEKHPPPPPPSPAAPCPPLHSHSTRRKCSSPHKRRAVRLMPCLAASAFRTWGAARKMGVQDVPNHAAAPAAPVSSTTCPDLCARGAGLGFLCQPHLVNPAWATPGSLWQGERYFPLSTGGGGWGRGV